MSGYLPLAERPFLQSRSELFNAELVLGFDSCQARSFAIDAISLVINKQEAAELGGGQNVIGSISVKENMLSEGLFSGRKGTAS